MIVTFDDMLDHLLAYAGMDAGASATALHRRAIQAAYQLIPSRHDWSYLRGICRVTTSTPYNTGTIAYDLTGGAYENMVTLSGGTWPTWAADGYVVISNIPYKVSERKSDTVLTLVAASAPAADIAAGTEYQILQDQYDLPFDFIAGDEATINEISTVLKYVHPRDWAAQRRVNSGPGQPMFHTYLGSPGTRGRLSVAIWPPSDASYVIDILYKRSMRPLSYSSISDGLAAVTADSTTVTGTSTAFKSGMVGSIIRFGVDLGKDIPTGVTGNNPFVYERTITAVASATSLTIDESIPEDIVAAPLLISDPIDISVDSMYEYFCRECEKQWRLLARSKPTVEEISVNNAAYSQSLQQAREADNRDQSRAASYRAQSRRSGFNHYPMNWSVS